MVLIHQFMVVDIHRDGDIPIRSNKLKIYEYKLLL